MSLSHTQLRSWYREYNRKWFAGALPDENMDVLYAPMDRDHGLAECHENEERIITIDTMYATPRVAKWFLLHEMNHHYTGEWRHGNRFHAGMMRLAMLGAFRRIW